MDTSTSPLDDITTALLDERDTAIREREAADAIVKACNIRLEQLMLLGNSICHQLTDGSVVQIIAPAPRETVIPEKLLAEGISPLIITRCTKITPIKASIRVDRPKGDSSRSHPGRATGPEDVAPERAPEPVN